MSSSTKAARRRVAVAATAVALVASSMSVGGSSPAYADPLVDLQILTVNDFHGRIDANAVKFAGTIEQLRADSASANGGVDNTILVGGGDFIGASLFASAVAQDQPTIDMFNALDLDVSAVGNHEFDRGFADLTDRVIAGGTNAQWDYLGANVYDTATGLPALPEYSVSVVNGVTVGVIGVVTQETPTLVSPGGVVSLTFGDPVDAVNRVAAQLTDGEAANGEADVLIATFHEGAPEGVAAGGTLENQLAASPVFAKIVNETSPRVAAIVGGHTHQAYAWEAPVPGVPGATRPVIQTGNYGANVGQITLTLDEGDGFAVVAHSVQTVSRTSTDDATLIAAFPRVAEVAGIVGAALTSAAEVGNAPIGAVTADITTAFAGGAFVGGVWTGGARDDRTAESTLGNLVADALLSSLAPTDRGGARIAVVNPGGLRGELYFAGDTGSNPANADGVVTYAEANAVLPFVNNLATVDLTGAQVVQLLEEQWQLTEAGTVPTRSYLQLGVSENMSYTFDPDPDGDGVVIGDLDDTGRHIASVTIDGAPIDLEAVYRVGTFTFLTGTGTAASAGGDNFWVFREAANFRDSGLVDRDAWIAYLGDNSPVSPSFAKRAVAVYDLRLGDVPVEVQPIVADPGAPVSLTVSTLELTSLGSPQVTSLTASLDAVGAAPAGAFAAAVALDPVPVVGGVATVTFAAPADPGAYLLTLSDAVTGTVVTVPLSFEAVTTEPTPTTGPTPTTQPTSTVPPPMPPGKGGGELVRTGGDGQVVAAFVWAAIALILLGVVLLVVVRRRAAARRE